MACHTIFPIIVLEAAVIITITLSLVSQNENSGIIYLPPCFKTYCFSMKHKNILRLLREREKLQDSKGELPVLFPFCLV